MKNNRYFALLLAALCASPISALAKPVRVLAASSMTNVMQDVAKAYQNDKQRTLSNVFAGSSSLARQIERGAPADLYISANQKWTRHLIDEGLAEEAKCRPLAGNALVLITPKENPVELPGPEALYSPKWWQDTLSNERLAVGNTRAVPAGIYAREALTYHNIWAVAEAHLAQTSNVRQALALVERGEAPLGIVYKTDAQMSDGVTILHQFIAQAHKPVVYPMVYFTQEGKALAEYMRSEKGTEILTRYGFVPVTLQGEGC